MIARWQNWWKRTARRVRKGEGRWWLSQRSRGRKPSRLRLELLEDRTVPSVFYTPAEIREAYGINLIQLGSAAAPITGNGAGQTIAVIELDVDPDIASDLPKFDTMRSTASLNLSTFGSFSGPVAGSTLPWFNAVWSPTNTTTT